LGGLLFAPFHLCTFRPIVVAHLTCVFLKLVDDMCIINLTLNVLPIFLRLQEKFGTIRLSLQSTKCVAWFPQRLNQSISLPLGFLTLESIIRILGAPMGSLPFVESFVSKAFQKDLDMIISLLMFADPHATFVMFSLCSA